MADFLESGQLVFSVSLGRNQRPWTLALMNMGTGEIRYLADYGNNNHALAPLWSPDGSRLLYSFNRNCDGIHVLDLTSEETWEINPPSSNEVDEKEECNAVWSPDGRRIAYMSRYNIYVSDTFGTLHKQITQNSGGFPVWTPDGEWIVYHSPQRNASRFQVRPDGSDDQPFLGSWLQDHGLMAGRPTWSPDASKVAFRASVWANGKTDALNWGKSQVYIADSYTGDPHPVTPLAFRFGEPIWSPDGKRICVTGTFVESYYSAALYIIEEGTFREAVPQIAYEGDFWHMWSPDGKYVVYSPLDMTTRLDGAGISVLEVSTGIIHDFMQGMLTGYPVPRPNSSQGSS